IASDALHGQDERYRSLAGAVAGRFAEGSVAPGCREFLKPLLAETVREPAEVICLVCHGYFSEDAPDDSGLLLGPPRGYIERSILMPGVGRGMFADLPYRPFPPRLATHADFPGDLLTVEELQVECRTRAELVLLVGCST